MLNHENRICVCIFICRALARKLKLMTFSPNWEIRTVFTKGCHHGWQQAIFYITTCRTPQNAILGNISKHDIINHKQIATEKCFFLYFKPDWDME